MYVETGDSVDCVKGLAISVPIHAYRVHIEVGDICLEGNGPFKTASLETPFVCSVTITDVDVIAVANGDVSGFGKFDTAEEGLAD